MPNIEDDIRKAGKRLKALRKTASAHNKANRMQSGWGWRVAWAGMAYMSRRMSGGGANGFWGVGVAGGGGCARSGLKT